MGFIENLTDFPKMKEFWKSVNISRSYRRELMIYFSLGHRVLIAFSAPR